MAEERNGPATPNLDALFPRRLKRLYEESFCPGDYLPKRYAYLNRRPFWIDRIRSDRMSDALLARMERAYSLSRALSGCGEGSCKERCGSCDTGG